MKIKNERTIKVDTSNKELIESYKLGAIEYFKERSPEAQYYEYVKPFTTIFGPPDQNQLYVCYLHDIANIIMALNLPGGCRVLDVACGAGWLSEFFFRYGYDVTGIDISDDLISIARDRIGSIKYTPFGRDQSYIRFKAMDIEREHLDANFDAIIFYDGLHHFSDIDRVFDNVKKMLSPGGKVLIKEGAMPPKGSKAEQELMEVFKEYNTLESPFDHDYLKNYLENSGFKYIKELIEINGFFEKSPTELAKIACLFNSPYNVNIFICQMEDIDLPNLNATWRADIVLTSLKEIEEDKSQKYLELILRITNVGDYAWKNDPNLQKIGSTTLGIKLYSPTGKLLDEILGRTPMPKTVNPGESIQLSVYYPLSCVDIKGECKLSVDMVLQGYFWFEQKGSKPLIIFIDA